MPTGFRLREAKESDIDYLAANLRDDDRRELEASAGKGNERAAIRRSLESCKKTYALACGDKIAALCGYKDGLVKNTAQCWTLTGKDIEGCKKEFLRATIAFLREVFENYEVCYNTVDARYARSLRWIKWFGGELKNDVYINGIRFTIWTLQSEDFYGRFNRQ
jgi:hypothetical protein